MGEKDKNWASDYVRGSYGEPTVTSTWGQIGRQELIAKQEIAARDRAMGRSTVGVTDPIATLIALRALAAGIMTAIFCWRHFTYEFDPNHLWSMGLGIAACFWAGGFLRLPVFGPVLGLLLIMIKAGSVVGIAVFAIWVVFGFQHTDFFQ